MGSESRSRESGGLARMQALPPLASVAATRSGIKAV